MWRKTHHEGHEERRNANGKIDSLRRRAYRMSWEFDNIESLRDLGALAVKTSLVAFGYKNHEIQEVLVYK